MSAIVAELKLISSGMKLVEWTWLLLSCGEEVKLVGQTCISLDCFECKGISASSLFIGLEGNVAVFHF